MLPFCFQAIRWEAYVQNAWRHFNSASWHRAEKAYQERISETPILVAPFGNTALEHPLKGPYDLVLAPFPIGPAPEYPALGGAVSDGHSLHVQVCLARSQRQ